MTKPQTLLQIIDRCPPFFCYALARTRSKNPRRLTPADIATTSGLSIRTVSRIGDKLSWAGIDTDVASRFADACNVDLVRVSEQRHFVKRTFTLRRPFNYLSSREWKYFQERSRRWAELKAKAAA